MILTKIDGYKLDHRRQYPEGTTRVYSNWTPRGSRLPDVTEVTFFGLRYFLQKYMMKDFDDQFFLANGGKMKARYAARVNSYLGPNSIGTEHIEALWRLGYVPLEFRAVPEGSAVPLRVPMLTVENTHDDFAWLVNYFETLMSNVLWLPCTSATQARRMRQVLDNGAKLTGGDPGFVDWQGHDFSFRGMSGPEAASLSGAGHLLFFTGTDTIPAIELIEDHYSPPEGYLIGGSVAATEHSVMCAGSQAGELETFERLLALYPTGIVSVVSDTWDLWKVLTQILPQLKDKIMARQGKLVIRPDSGDPVKILCGDPDAPEGSPARKGTIELLWDLFGGTKTSTGHKLLDSHIGAIYGDSITVERANEIVKRLHAKGFASVNTVLGIGSYTYQYVTRDTFGFAMKATWAKIGGVGHNLFKKPVTDNGTKNSAVGRLAVLPHAEQGMILVNEATPEQEASSLLQPVWRDGHFIGEPDSFDKIRARARNTL